MKINQEIKKIGIIKEKLKHQQKRKVRYMKKIMKNSREGRKRHINGKKMYKNNNNIYGITDDQTNYKIIITIPIKFSLIISCRISIVKIIAKIICVVNSK